MQTNPQHVAIVMDGNGRWAKRRFMTRVSGHRVGVKAVRKAVDFCVKNKIEVLSLFALSIENFRSRPKAEVRFLVFLLSDALIKNTEELHRNNVRIRIIGDCSVFEKPFRDQIEYAQTLTQHNSGLTLVIALHYSGRWDILQAVQKCVQHAIDHAIDPQKLTENDFSQFLCLHDLPEPDLLIRTSGEKRISNFMLWQFAYTELCFVDALWPDFDDHVFSDAIHDFQKRERRFGLISEQIVQL